MPVLHAPFRTIVSCAALLGLSGTAAAASAQSAPQTTIPSPPRYVMPDTEAWEISGAEGVYRIFVSRPKGEPPEGGFPVLYVLDGNAMFAGFAETRRIQETADPNIGKSIIVAVGYPTDMPYDTRRLYDYTPAIPDPPPPGQAALAKSRTGGNDRFLDFLIDKLRSEIARRYTINPKRQALFGHSLGGLLALHALYTRPDAFHAIIAASPSQWWNEQSILAQERAFTKRLTEDKIKGPVARLFLVAGALEERIWNTWDAEALARRLEPLSAHGLRTRSEIFRYETHISVPARAITPALRFAFTYP